VAGQHLYVGQEAEPLDSLVHRRGPPQQPRGCLMDGLAQRAVPHGSHRRQPLVQLGHEPPRHRQERGLQLGGAHAQRADVPLRMNTVPPQHWSWLRRWERMCLRATISAWCPEPCEME